MRNEKEFQVLAQNLKQSPEQLTKVLTRQRLNMDDTSEKSIYIDWLLGRRETLEEETLPNNQKKKAKPSSNIKPLNALKDTQDSKKKTKGQQEQQTFLTSDIFADRKDLHPASKRALTEVLGITSMTEIQSKTFEAAASGRDVLGRARTGTGKTLAFLIPAVECVLRNPDYQPGKSIGVLVISPTRELAIQIGDQAEKLLTFHRSFNVQVVYGGTKMSRDVTQLRKTLPTILVATPGRLLDHLESTLIGNQRFGQDIMCNTPVVVLDETDRLLDMGFRREIRKILKFLPPKSENRRQTLLFSATIPPELKSIMADTMKDDYIEVDCINDGDGTSHTSANVQQSHVILPSMDRYVSSVVEIITKAMENKDHGSNNNKIVVFFTTARMVAYFSELFNNGLNINVLELHSKKTQGYRNRVSEEFRQATNGILFTSDVSARGVDYPGVTQVIQFGIPESKEQYIHRLGRTARAGTNGKGLLILAPFESLFLQELKQLDIPRNEELHQLLHEPLSNDIIDSLSTAFGYNDPEAGTSRKGSKVRKSLRISAQGAYQAFLGYYLGQMKRLQMKHKEDLVSIANTFSNQMGLEEIPGLTKNMVNKMGLKNIQGVVVKSSTDEDYDESSYYDSNRSGGRSGGGARSGGGGGGRNRQQRSGHNDGRRKLSSRGSGGGGSGNGGGSGSISRSGSGSNYRSKRGGR